MLISTKEVAFTKDQIEKIGNTIIYLCKEIPNINKTKILKILFLLEEASIKKYCQPFFGVDFQLWQHGPVIKDIFIDFAEENNFELLKSFIKKDASGHFVPKIEFNDDQFSDNDILLLEKTIAYAKPLTAKRLVDITHSQNSLWRKSAIKHGVLEILEKKLKTSTESTIDFSLLFEEDNNNKELFIDKLESLEFINQLKY